MLNQDLLNEINAIKDKIECVNDGHANDINILEEELKEKQKSLKESAQAAISFHVNAAHKSIQAAEEIAEASGESFYFDVEYGMGGTYYPKGTGYGSDGWISSSSQC